MEEELQQIEDQLRERERMAVACGPDHHGNSIRSSGHL